jgi:GDP-D-mannose 3', 5'-epimerase
MLFKRIMVKRSFATSTLRVLVVMIAFVLIFFIFFSIGYSVSLLGRWRTFDAQQKNVGSFARQIIPVRGSCDEVGGVADYLVTGGAGFIGSALVKRLHQLQPRAVIKVVDNLWRGNVENLREREGGGYAIDLDLHFHNVDLTNFEDAARVIRCARNVFHLADIVAGIDYVFANQGFLFRQNILINTNTLAAANAPNSFVENYTYVGTACSFPRHLQNSYEIVSLTENQTYPANPESSYGWSKLMGEYEAGLQGKRPDNKLNISVLRFHNVYGPGMIWGSGAQAISALIFKAINLEGGNRSDVYLDVFGSGNQYRDFVFIDDIVDALLLAPRVSGKGVVQIGTGRAVSIRELVEMIANMVEFALGKKIVPRFSPGGLEGDRGRVSFTHKAETLLGWRAKTSFEEGLAKTFQHISSGMLPSFGTKSSPQTPPASFHMVRLLEKWAQDMRENSTLCRHGLMSSTEGIRRKSLEHPLPIDPNNPSKIPPRLRILVILVGQPRGGELAYRSMEKYLLKPHDADLATFFTETAPMTYLQKKARFNWVVPEYDDWFSIMDKISATCVGEGNVQNLRNSLWGPDKGGSKFLGHDSLSVAHATSSVILLSFRWLVQQKLLQLRLDEEYDIFVFSRADEAYICNHYPISELYEKCPNCAWCTEGEEYGGFSDRHWIAPARVFGQAMNMTTHVLCNSDRFFGKVQNLETLIKVSFEDTKIEVRQFPPSFFTVQRPYDRTKFPSWTTYPDAPADAASFGLVLKYPGEYNRAKERCGLDMTSAFNELKNVNLSAP